MWNDFYLNIELINPNAKMPVRAHVGSDAGCDVFTPTDVVIEPHSDVLIGTGWRCEFPDGYAMIVKEKSGIATKKKLDCGASVIDSSFRGETHIHLFNNSDKRVEFKAGEKIAQFVVFPVWTGEPKQVEHVDLNTERGSGGFGSTGK